MKRHEGGIGTRRSRSDASKLRAEMRGHSGTDAVNFGVSPTEDDLDPADRARLQSVPAEGTWNPVFRQSQT